MQTRLSSKGQIVIPKPIRERLDLRPGQTLRVRQEGQRIVLEVDTALPTTRLEDVAGMLHRPDVPYDSREADSAALAAARHREKDATAS